MLFVVDGILVVVGASEGIVVVWTVVGDGPIVVVVLSVVVSVVVGDVGLTDCVVDDVVVTKSTFIVVLVFGVVAVVVVLREVAVVVSGEAVVEEVSFLGVVVLLVIEDGVLVNSDLADDNNIVTCEVIEEGTDVDVVEDLSVVVDGFSGILLISPAKHILRLFIHNIW